MKMTDEEAVRFEQYTIRTEGCWEWIGHLSRGYGRIRIGGKCVQAHRASYEHFIGEIPAGLTIDHLCRNKACVNPWHLEPVTMRENTMRAKSPVSENAHKTTCVRGHQLSEENLSAAGLARGERICMECRRIRARRLYHSDVDRIRAYHASKMRQYRAAALNAEEASRG